MSSRTLVITVEQKDGKMYVQMDGSAATGAPDQNVDRVTALILETLKAVFPHLIPVTMGVGTGDTIAQARTAARLDHDIQKSGEPDAKEEEKTDPS